MAELKDFVCSDDNRASVVRDTAQLVDEEVRAKGGFSGAAIKLGYKTVKAVKPGLIPNVVDGLLDNFTSRLQPFFADWDGAGRSGSFSSFMTSKERDVANALLGVTDDRAKVVQNKTLKKAYGKLRPKGEEHVTAAVPGLGRLLDRYIK